MLKRHTSFSSSSTLSPMRKSSTSSSSIFSFKYFVIFIVIFFVIIQLFMTYQATNNDDIVTTTTPTTNNNNPTSTIPITPKNSPILTSEIPIKITIQPTLKPIPITLEPSNNKIISSSSSSSTTTIDLSTDDDHDLTKNTSLISKLPIQILPNISLDESEYILNSLIERTSNSWSLHLTTMFLSRAMIDPDEIRANKVSKIRLSTIQKWTTINKKQREIYYHANGKRLLHKYECRIQLSDDVQTTYTVPGYFLPNRQTTDSNANRRIDILRCALKKSQQIYLKYANSHHILYFEILRNGNIITRISIPWNTRRTGYLLSSPSQASKFNPWKGFQSPSPSNNNNNNRHLVPSSLQSPGDNIYICTPDNKSFNQRSKIFRMLEFIQHHVMIKVDHIFFSSGFSWESSEMEILLKALSRYITYQQVSIVSTAGDNIHNIGSFGGLAWSIIPLINFHLNSCLFLAKGTADYIGVWDINEFFVPRLPYSNIVEVLESVNQPKDILLLPSNISSDTKSINWKGGPGWADGDGHPFCYLSLYAIELFSNKQETIPTSLSNFHQSIWSSSRYGPLPPNRPTDTSKSILPTNTIFQAGPHISGACKLNYEWTSCSKRNNSNDKKDNEFCYLDINTNDYIDNQFNNNPPKFPSTHDIDSVVLDRDIKKINMDSQGMLVRFSRGLSTTQKTTTSSSTLEEENENTNSNQILTRVESVLQSYYSREELFSFILPDDSLSKLTSSGDWISYVTAFPPALKESSSINIPQQLEVNMKDGSNDGYFNFQEPFTKNDILENPPNNFLPTFAFDYSDILLGSLIERKHNSWDLHVTAFFMSHTLIRDPPKGYGMRRLSPINSLKWKIAFRKFNYTRYLRGGRRDSKYYNMKCRIMNGPGQEFYEVDGEFVPNSLTPDGNANKRVDIFRCKIKNSQECYQKLANTNTSIYVEIYKNNEKLFQYTISWKTRRIGFLLNTPKEATSFNPWKGYNPKNNNRNIKPGDIDSDNLYMAVPGIESPMTQKNLPMFVEFMQHHYLLGVQHMFWGVTYSWNGLNMANFISTFQQFINEKLLTVTSQSGDNIDLLYSILGASLDRDNVKIMYVNMYLYLTKGVVDYLAIWDIDEYFIPRYPYTSIMDIIRLAESNETLQPKESDKKLLQLSQEWKGGRGWADGDAHPFCYLMIFSEVIYGTPSSFIYDSNKPWIGERIRHLPEKSGLAFKKSIVPTRRIFQVGLHMHGACNLEKEFQGPDCLENDEFCYSKDEYEGRGNAVTPNGIVLPFSTYHKFDSSVYDRDAKAINIQTEATIYHFQIHRGHLTANPEVLNEQVNDYVGRFYPNVLKELERRKFPLLISLPDQTIHTEKQLSHLNWMPLEEFRNKLIENNNSKINQQNYRINPMISREYKEDLKSELPFITKDFSEIFLSALIERDADSYALFLTMFLISREQLANKSKRINNHSIRPDSIGSWIKATEYAIKTSEIYTEFGTRSDNYIYTCKILNYKNDEIYIVKGIFIPNQLTPDANANRRLDILRCPIQNTEYIYNNLIYSNEELYAEIYRNHECLIKYKIPWKTRKLGYMLSTPSYASTLDVWKGSNNTSKMDTIHMCIPGIESPISKTTLAIYSEFFEYHYMIGIEHIHAAVTYTWNGENMKKFLLVYDNYIQNGKMSITSTAGDIDGMYGLFGMNMERDNVKVFNVNMCLYLTKGIADYVAIWDIDEYFIPKPPHHTILDVLRVVETSKPLPTFKKNDNPFEIFPNWKGGPGWADGDGHPFCYLMMSSKALYRASTLPDIASSQYPWIGNRFIVAPENDSYLQFKKPIIPTRRIFQAALHMVGGCKLDSPWNGCETTLNNNYNINNGRKNNSTDDFCYIQFPRQRYGLTINQTTNELIDFSFEQRFDGLLLDKDAKKINMETEALIYHFQVHRNYYISTSAQSTTNEYIQNWFSKVRQRLRERGLEIYATLPSHIPFGQKKDEIFGWPLFSEEYAKVGATPD